MKVLLANNYFYLKGGSEKVFFDEANLLKIHGHDVFYFATHNDENFETPYSEYFVSKLKYNILSTPRFIYGLESKNKLKRLIDKYKPDIAHLHNIYQDISPSVLPVLKNNGIPRIVTLHDHKLICPNYTMSRNGVICEECFGGHFYKCLLNRCKEGSYAYSMVLMLESYVHKLLKIWEDNVDVFISPSQYLREKLVNFGWDSSIIDVIPNSLPLERYTPAYNSGDYFVFLGRLSSEKGLFTLVKAFKDLLPSARLIIVGDGPLGEVLKNQTRNDVRVVYTGHILGERLSKTVKEARVVVLPSECYENAPMSIIEAFAYGKPVIGARIGGIPEMIDDGINGLLFESGSVEDLRDKMECFLNLPDIKIREMGMAAREKAEREYNAELHYERLMDVYQKAINEG